LRQRTTHPRPQRTNAARNLATFSASPVALAATMPAAKLAMISSALTPCSAYTNNNNHTHQCDRDTTPQPPPQTQRSTPHNGKNTMHSLVLVDVIDNVRWKSKRTTADKSPPSQAHTRAHKTDAITEETCWSKSPASKHTHTHTLAPVPSE
jgi:hypothetical protein